MRLFRIAGLLLLSLTLNGLAQQALPDAVLTPGAILPETSEQLCASGFRTASVRHVTASERRAVFLEYGVSMEDRSYYEVDHLIALELGGSSDIKNLWAEPWHFNVNGFDEGAKVKDNLENRLHELVSEGTLSLEEAQSLISHNWIAAYQKYIGQLPVYEGGGTIQDIHHVPKIETP
jgi:hypothetical protein